MRVSYNWLRDYLHLDIDAHQLAEKMTFAGLEIDDVESRGTELSGIVVGKVKTCENMEMSDHCIYVRYLTARPIVPLFVVRPILRWGKLWLLPPSVLFCPVGSPSAAKMLWV